MPQKNGIPRYAVATYALAAFAITFAISAAAPVDGVVLYSATVSAPSVVAIADTSEAVSVASISSTVSYIERF